MYNCANLLSYSFYIESSFLLLLIFTFYMYMNQINKIKIALYNYNNCEVSGMYLYISKAEQYFFIKQEDLLKVKNIMLN